VAGAGLAEALRSVIGCCQMVASTTNQARGDALAVGLWAAGADAERLARAQAAHISDFWWQMDEGAVARGRSLVQPLAVRDCGEHWHGLVEGKQGQRVLAPWITPTSRRSSGRCGPQHWALVERTRTGGC